MPWVPELFTAPALRRILDQRPGDALAAVPYFDGLMADDPEPLVESFAGGPEVHDPVRGRIKGATAAPSGPHRPRVQGVRGRDQRVAPDRLVRLGPPRYLLPPLPR